MNNNECRRNSGKPEKHFCAILLAEMRPNQITAVRNAISASKSLLEY